MKFDINPAAPFNPPAGAPKVGDVFPAKGTGPKHYRAGTRYFMIVAITNNQFGYPTSHHMLGLDGEGNIVSTTTYGEHVMRERVRIGHCPDITKLDNLKIEWER